MARKTYGHSDETFRALIGHEADIAKQMECDPSYIYGIKNRSQKDPFPQFREIYRATARGGGDTSFWRNDLDAIDASVRRSQTEVELTNLLLDKIHIDGVSTEEIVRSMADGKIDRDECDRLKRLMKTIRANTDMIDSLLDLRMAELQGECSGQGLVVGGRFRK